MIGRDYPSLKITVPEVSEMVLPRREIIKIIDNTPLSNLIYITAPYGSGKTLAVISWLRSHQQDAAWVSVGVQDISTEVLCPLLAGSILQLAGEHDEAAKIIQGTHSKESALSLLSDTLIRVSPIIKNMTLIIDNSNILRNTEVLKDTRSMIYNMLGCWRVIFIGRGELPPVLNDLILKKCLCRITVDDLSFSQDEISDYFRMNGHNVTGKDLARIREETDGWPASLNAILITPQNGKIEYNFTAQSYIMNYFESEIWKPLDKATKKFLVKTAILEKLTPSICHFLAEEDKTHSILNNLYASVFFSQSWRSLIHIVTIVFLKNSCCSSLILRAWM